MNNKQQASREIAARKFMHSLEELETVFQSDSTTSKPSAAIDIDPPQVDPDKTAQFPHAENSESLGALLDEAVQDIDQFMAQHLNDLNE
ncbi:hypothetical protein PN498_03435 [Oscillatoria sp. CS-180]|uniref:hypothetical protein n=1 Tax=Oscillatoria sp. CS-180 TaxID=3021720 RepID=UPI0023305A11|nr:hypothetical protein [Oscillatoria sp. CS-180]MDB9525029.1 hypothetical protein [Oscillatoria sp. CS-180]